MVIDSIKEDIAAQLNAGGSVLYTAAEGVSGAGVMRAAESPEGVQVTGIAVSDEGIFIGDAQFTNEESIDVEATPAALTDDAEDSKQN